MMDIEDRDWILLLDDDAFFRKLICDMLVALGHSVFEARNAQEATHAVNVRKPELAIVDYRLPGMDGITWIGRMRDEGHQFPVVFLSGQFCDAQMFNKLRNLLKVSLILQKPIVPELFLEQVGLFLPSPSAIPKRPGASGLSADKAGTQAQTQSAAERSRKAETQVKEMMQSELKHPPAVERALQAARKEYAAELPQAIKELAQNIRAAKESASDKDAFGQAVHIAHKLHGSAGSYGFANISEGAGKIENLLRSLENQDNTMEEILWSELIRTLADTESAAKVSIRQVVPESEDTPPGRMMPRHVIFLSNDNMMRAAVMPLMEEGVCDVTISASYDQALNSAQEQRPDVIFIDLSACSKGDVFSFVSRIRALPDCQNVPFALLTDSTSQLRDGEALYLGGSVVIDKPVSGTALSAAVQDLLSLRQTFMPRLLTVDDDDMLCTFIKTVMEPQGMVVKSLNEPIKIIEVLDAFAPDVVLLDVMMPAISGYDVCRMIRQKERWKELKVLFLTSKSSTEGRASAFRAGADDFLAKPVVSEELIARVKSQLERSLTMNERFARDPLTGVLQRAPFEKAATKLVEIARQNKTLVTLVLLEIEKIRDRAAQYGLTTAERVIAHLGKLIQARFRAEDVRARLGDYIVLVVPGKDGEATMEALLLLAEEFHQTKFDTGDGSVFRNTLKFGLAQLWRDCDDAVGLIQAASTALFNN